MSHGPAPRDAHNQAIPHQEEEPFHVEVKLEEGEGHHAVDNVIHGKGGEHQTHVVEEEEEDPVYHPPPPPPPPPVHHEVVSSWEEAEEVRQISQMMQALKKRIPCANIRSPPGTTVRTTPCRRRRHRRR